MLRIRRIPDPGFYPSRISGIVELFTQKLSLSSQKYGFWIWDPRSGIREKPIPDPGSRGQKGTGSRIRIRNTEERGLTGCYVPSTPSQLPLCEHIQTLFQRSPEPQEALPVSFSVGVDSACCLE